MYKLNIEKRNDFKDMLWLQGAERNTPTTGLAGVRNFIYTDKGRLRLRGGFSKLNTTPLPGSITGMKQVPWDVSSNKFVCASLTNIYSWNTQTSAFDPIYTLQTSGKPTSFAADGGVLLFCNGTDPMMYYNGSICQEVIKPLGGWYADQQPSFVIIHKNRAWCVVGPMVYTSDLQVPYDFQNGTATQFPTGNSDPVATLIDALDRLFVIKDKSIGYIYQPASEYSLYMGAVSSDAWVFRMAYSSVTGTSSPFGACGFGEMFYYGSPDGLFEVAASGRETIGNLNTNRIELLGIAPMFSPGCSEHLNFNSFENLLVVPHFRRNEVWFFVGSTSTTLDTVLVYSRALKRWTIFSIPNCMSACSYITNAYRRVVAIGTTGGYVGLSDQTFDGLDLGVDFVGNSYLDFVFSGQDAGEFCKNWRMLTPTIQGTQYCYSTKFDACRPGKTNVPVIMSGSPDTVAHEVPLELDGRGFYCRIRISGVVGQWPLELESILSGSKVVRQRRFSTITNTDPWSVGPPSDFTKARFPIGSWVHPAGLNKFFLANNSVKVEQVQYKEVHYVSGNQIVSSNKLGSGYFVSIVGIYLKDEVFLYDDLLAPPQNLSAVDYYVGGSFINESELFKTTITLGSSLADGTEVIVRYIYETVEEDVYAYAPAINTPCVRTATNKFYWSPACITKLMFSLWSYGLEVPTAQFYIDALLQFLWNQILYITSKQESSVFSINPADGHTLINFGLVNDTEGLMQVTFDDKIEVFNGPGIECFFQPTTVTALGWFSYYLDWAQAIVDKLINVIFTFNGTQSGQMIQVCLAAIPELLSPMDDEKLYITGLPDVVSVPTKVTIPINQFYRSASIIWDGIRTDPPNLVHTYTGSPTVISVDKTNRAAFLTSDGDVLYSLLHWKCPDANVSSFVSVIPISGLDSAVLHDGICFLYRITDTIRTPTITVKIHSSSGYYTASFTHSGSSGWIRKSLLWAAFVSYPGSEDIDSITFTIGPCTSFEFTDIAYCTASGLPVRYRFSDEATFCRSLTFLWKNDTEAKVIHNYSYNYYVYFPTVDGGRETQQHSANATEVITEGVESPTSLYILLTNINFEFSDGEAYPYLLAKEALIQTTKLIGYRGPILVGDINASAIQPLRSKNLDHVEFGYSAYRRISLDAQRSRGIGYFPVQGSLQYENLSSCGMLNGFEWDRKYPTKGLEVGAWVYDFTNSLWSNWARNSGVFLHDITQAATLPVLVPGLRDSTLDTAGAFEDGVTGVASLSDTGFIELNSLESDPQSGFSFTLIIKADVQANSDRIFIQHYNGTIGWQIKAATASDPTLSLYIDDGVSPISIDIPDVLDDTFHIVQFSAQRSGVGLFDVSARLDGVEIVAAAPISYLPTAAIADALEFGVSGSFTLDLFKFDIRYISLEEFQYFCNVITGQENCSNTPECGTIVGQLKIIKNLLLWQVINSYGVPDFDSMPDVDTITDVDGTVEETLFTLTETLLNYYYIHPYGATINILDSSDPSPLALACEIGILLYWGVGETAIVKGATITSWLDTLRGFLLGDGTAGNNIKYTEYMIRLLTPFGLAIHEMAGPIINFHFPMTATNIAFWQAEIVAFRAKLGSSKPNYFTNELLPYYYYNDQDQLTDAPLIERNLGDIDTVVSLIPLALLYARLVGDYNWYQRLVNFILRITY